MATEARPVRSVLGTASPYDTMSSSTKLHPGMVEQRKQGSPLIACPDFQLLFDIIHLPIETIVLGIVIVAHRLMLIQRDGDEALHQLIHCHVGEFGAAHGLRTPRSINAFLSTLTRSAQSFPRRYSRGDNPPHLLLLVPYHAVISQCLNLEMRTKLSGSSITDLGKPSCSADVRSTM
jgi:hypothetical protein